MPDEQETQSPLPLNPDLMGYQTVEALVAAKRAGDAEARRLVEDNQRKDALLAQALSAANPRTVPDRRMTARERLRDFGVPDDAIVDVTREVVREELTPLLNAGEARGRFITEHPDYLQFENDVAAFISQDPAFAEKYWRDMASPNVSDRISAMEHAFLKFGESRRRSVPAPDGAGRGSADAAIPSSRAGDGRRGPDTTAELQEAFERYQRTGSSKDAQLYARARLGPLLKEQFRAAGQEL